MVNYGNVIQIGGSLLLTIITGYTCCKLKIFPSESIQVLNKFILKICFFPLMVNALWQRDLKTISIMPFVVGACANITLHLLMCAIFLMPFKDRFQIYLSSIIPTVCVNYLIVGFPIFNSIWPEKENVMLPVISISNDPICVPIFLILSNIYRIKKENSEFRRTGQGTESKFSAKIILTIIIRVISNPIIIGLIFGFLWAGIGLKECPFLSKVFLHLKNAVMTFCLFNVGGFLSQRSIIACNWIRFIICLLLRHIGYPTLIGLYCYAFGVNPRLSRQCMIVSCLPSANTSFLLTSEADLKPGLSSTMIFWTTILCIPFQIMWLFVLNSLHIFVDE